MKIISIVNQKGGVGKTTLAFNLAHLLKDRGYRILAVDLDPQANLTLSVLGEIPEEASSYEMLLNGKISIKKSKSYDIIPSSLSLATVEPKLLSAIAKEYRLLKALQKIDENYDVIIIDTPPNLGILTLNALIASDGILIPVETRFYGLVGLKHLMDVLQEIKEYLDRKIEIIGIVPTMYEKNVSLHKEALEELKNLPFKVFPPIYKRTAFQYASATGQPVYKESIDKETFENLKTIAKEVEIWLRKD